MNLIKTLLSLFIVCSFLPLSSLAFRYTSEIEFDYSEINDEIALYQLREILLISYDMYISSDQLSFIYQNKDFRLSLVNNKLLLQPGTQIFLDEVDNLYFDNIDNNIYIFYEKNNKTYQRILASAKGIYLDEFSDCFVSDDVDSDIEE